MQTMTTTEVQQAIESGIALKLIDVREEEEVEEVISLALLIFH